MSNRDALTEDAESSRILKTKGFQEVHLFCRIQKCLSFPGVDISDKHIEIRSGDAEE
jgi:hypothetical protein